MHNLGSECLVAMEIGKDLQYRYLIFTRMQKGTGIQKYLPCNLEQFHRLSIINWHLKKSRL